MSTSRVRMAETARPALRISLFYTAYFTMVGVYQPFFPLWLESRGLDATDIAWVMAASIFLRVAVNPGVMLFADWRGERRRYAFRFALASVAVAACFPLAEGFWPVLGLVLLFALAHGPTLPLSDNIALLTARARRLDYGRMRVWGSVAFILASTAGGWALAGRGDEAIVAAMVAGLLLVAAATATLPDARPETPPGARRAMRRTLGRLVRDPGFLLCTGAIAFNMASHAVLMGYGTIHWEKAGYDKDITGPLWAVGVISEVALFALGNRVVNRLGIAGLIALGASAAMLRWAGTALTTDLWLLAPVQMLHGFTFAATHLGGMIYLQRHVPPEISATAQGLYSSIAMGGALGCALLAAGPLYESFGGDAFWFMSTLSACSLLLAGVLARRMRRSTPPQG